jgi:hypothetical protein
MKKQDAVMAIIWVILGFVILIWSATFPFGNAKAMGPAIFPFACGLTLVFLGGMLFFKSMRQTLGKAKEMSVSLIPHREAFRRVYLSFGGMLASALLFEVLGFTLTMFCQILVLMIVVTPQQRCKINFFYATVFTLGSYMLFKVFLKTTLPVGAVGF